METFKFNDHKIGTCEIDVVDQLQKINMAANEMLDVLLRWNRGDDEALQVLESQVRKVRIGTGQNAEEITEYTLSDPRKLAFKAMQEIRGQLKLQLEIFQTLYSTKAVQEFQAGVLEMMGKISPEARDEFIRLLTERNGLRSNLDHN